MSEWPKTMQPIPPNRFHRTLRAIGSLWLAAVLMVLLLIAMAFATIFESQSGTEYALEIFYHSAPFEWLLALVGVNMLAALVVRYPFTGKQVGFVLTHASVLLLFIGALTTKYFGIDGNLGIAEQQTVEYFSSPGQTLTLVNQQTNKRASMDLAEPVGGFDVIDGIDTPALTFGPVELVALEYLPDSEVRQTIVDDAPHAHPAIEVALSDAKKTVSTWVFLGQPVTIGPTSVGFRILDDDQQLADLAIDEAADQPRSKGVVRLTLPGGEYELPVESCEEDPVSLGEDGLTVKVLRFLPHATVGVDGEVVSASPQPLNPAIEVELVRGDERETRIAFARFPDFESMHGQETLSGIKVVYALPQTLVPHAPVEVLSSKNGDLYVRFAWEGTALQTSAVKLGESIETPWPGKRLTVRKRFDSARTIRAVAAVDPVRSKNRVPAVRVRVTTADSTSEMWVRRHQPRRFSVDETPYEINYGGKLIPLGFKVTLNRFRVGYYPGTRRPRSFESNIEIVDAATGRSQTRVVSMNNPTSYGGFTFYQSSYSQEPNRTISYLSVSRDPGQPLVFAGYIGLMAGMIVVLVIRVRSGKHGYEDQQNSHGHNGHDIALIDTERACLNGLEDLPESATPRPVPLVRR